MRNPQFTTHQDLQYVADGHERQILDLYLPQRATPAPLIIWLHGGGYRRRGKEDVRSYLGYLDYGFAIASVNYRLSQHALFPAQLEDAKAAVRWLRAHAETYNLDATRFIAWGISAGAHLAILLGTTGHVAKFDVGAHLHVSSQVQGVIDYFGPVDFLQMDAHRLPDGLRNDDPNAPGSLLVGGPIQDHPDRVAPTNPIRYLTEDVPSFLIVHGKRDRLVPHHQSVLLHDALTKVGADVTFYTVEDGDHGNIEDPTVDAVTLAFLQQVGFN